MNEKTIIEKRLSFYKDAYYNAREALTSAQIISNKIDFTGVEWCFRIVENFYWKLVEEFHKNYVITTPWGQRENISAAIKILDDLHNLSFCFFEFIQKFEGKKPNEIIWDARRFEYTMANLLDEKYFGTPITHLR